MNTLNYNTTENQQDSLNTDPLADRPLPKWLTDQRDSLNYWQPVKAEMKDDHYLEVTIIATGLVILLTLLVATILVLKKGKK
jgi:hypothetical protein